MLILSNGYARANAAGSSPTISSTAKSLYVIWRATDVTSDRFIFGLSRGTDDFQRSVGIVVSGGNVMRRYFNGSNNNGTIGAVSTNTWYKTLLTQDGSGTDRGYLDSTTPVNVDNTAMTESLVSCQFGLGFANFGNLTNAYTNPDGMDIAHAYYWSSVLSSGDITSLMGGSNPSGISTGTRVQGYSCISNGNEIAGGTVLTTSGSTSFDATDPLGGGGAVVRNNLMLLGCG